MLLGIYSQWQVLSRALRAATEGEERLETSRVACNHRLSSSSSNSGRALGGLVKPLHPSEAIPVEVIHGEMEIVQKIYILHLNPSRAFFLCLSQ